MGFGLLIWFVIVLDFGNRFGSSWTKIETGKVFPTRNDVRSRRKWDP